MLKRISQHCLQTGLAIKSFGTMSVATSNAYNNMHPEISETVTQKVTTRMKDDKRQRHLSQLNRLVLMGVPGAGKGTFARLMKKDLNDIDIIVAGDVIRYNIQQKTTIGIKIKKLVDQGELVPDEIVSSLVMPKREELNGRYCLDGYPRTISQCTLLHDSPMRPELVLDFRIPDDVLVMKNINRWNCQKCGEGYNTADIRGTYNGVVLNMPPLLPQEEGKCDKCEGELKQRTDDTEETVRTRLKVYARETEPLLDFYEKQGVLLRWDVINGVQDYPDLVRKVDNFLSTML